MKKQEVAGILCLWVTALIWGTAFVAQKSGLDYLGPFTFNGVRSFIGGLALLPCIVIIDLVNGQRPSLWGSCGSGERRLALIKGGGYCGIILGIASSLQQYGIKYTSVGKAGFITTLYIIIVPMLGVFFRRKVGIVMWLCSLLAIFGMYLLCFCGIGSQNVGGGETLHGIRVFGGLNVGDLLVFLCSIVFSFHILVVDRFAPQADGVRMSCIQFWVAGIIATGCALIFENVVWRDLLNAKWPLLYAGVMSCGVAYTLQIIGQKSVQPVVASLLMSLESVFAALSGWVILHERLNGTELLGCAIIFVAVIVAQLGDVKGKKNDRN